jgi:putative ABC transport system permease protein
VPEASQGLRARGLLLAWLLRAQWRNQPARLACAALAIAIGVSLGLAIDLVNRSAVGEFSRALAIVNGEAHASIRARGTGFDERLFDAVIADAAIANASPVVDTMLHHRGHGVRVIGIDPMRAAPVTPELLPRTDDAGSRSDLFGDDVIFLSAAAARAWQTRPGEILQLQHGPAPIALRVAGDLPGVAPDQELAVMDLGALQWRLDWLGRLSRIDLRLAEGSDARATEQAWRARLPADADWTTPRAGEQRMSNLSRAYRVNLSVLALVALLTGGFIVHATVSLATARQLPVLALLAMLGASPRFVLGCVLAQGLLLGGIGALAGIAAGIALAATLLATTGADLGGGYFVARPARLALDAMPVALYAALGLGAALLASLGPAVAARRMEPTRAIRLGGELPTQPPARNRRSALLLIVAGATLCALPATGRLPIAAYAAIACWLFAGILLVGTLTRAAATAAGSFESALWRKPAAWLALRRVRATPGAASVALAGIVASVALSSAMTIMVDSFRQSVSSWLDTVLPADLYGRLNARAPGTGLSPAWEAKLAAIPGVASVELLRATDLSLQPERPPVALLVRPIDRDAPHTALPLIGTTHEVPRDERPAWVSEAMSRLYGLAPGSIVELPLAASGQAFRVAGVWRDYARQHGAIVIDRHEYVALTGDDKASDVAVRLAPGADEAAVLASLRARLPQAESVEWRSAGEIRALSLRIFDRSFAITYVLEAIAIAVGLFGVAATYAGQALSRTREFGMLRHLGVGATRIMRMCALEAAILIGCGAAWGTSLGAAIAWVLVHRVNPQSFNWTMDMRWPLALLAASAAALVLLGVVAALAASRAAVSASPIRSVREDW